MFVCMLVCSMAIYEFSIGLFVYIHLYIHRNICIYIYICNLYPYIHRNIYIYICIYNLGKSGYKDPFRPSLNSCARGSSTASALLTSS